MSYKLDVFKISFIISCTFHFSLLLIPAFRSIQGDINPNRYKLVQLMNLEPAVSQPQAQKSEGEIKLAKEDKGAVIVKKPQDDGQFSVYLPFFKVMRLPEFMVKIKPIYPPKAKLKGIESEVLVEVYIDAEGKPRKVAVLKSGGEDFDSSTIESVYKSIFKPAISKEGKPVPVRVRIPFKFELE